MRPYSVSFQSVDAHIQVLTRWYSLAPTLKTNPRPAVLHQAKEAASLAGAFLVAPHHSTLNIYLFTQVIKYGVFYILVIAFFVALIALRKFRSLAFNNLTHLDYTSCYFPHYPTFQLHTL
jgi:hypothetical protein